MLFAMSFKCFMDLSLSGSLEPLLVQKDRALFSGLCVCIPFGPHLNFSFAGLLPTRHHSARFPRDYFLPDVLRV
jgi:hypothetical protein